MPTSDEDGSIRPWRWSSSLTLPRMRSLLDRGIAHARPSSGRMRVVYICLVDAADLGFSKMLTSMIDRIHNCNSVRRRRHFGLAPERRITQHS